MEIKEKIRKEYENTSETTRGLAKKHSIKIGTLKSWMARDSKKGDKWTKKDAKKVAKFKKVAEEVAYIGRPRTINSEEQLQRIRDAACLGLSNVKIALKTGIPRSTLADYFRNNPKFSEEIEELKESTKMKAQVLINQEIEEGNIKVAQWYLEKTDKEYNPVKKLDIEKSIPVVIKNEEERKRRIAELKKKKGD